MYRERKNGGRGLGPRLLSENKQEGSPPRRGIGGRPKWRGSQAFSLIFDPLRQPIGIGGMGSISREKCKFLAVSVRYWRKGSEARAGPVRERPLETGNLGCIAQDTHTQVPTAGCWECRKQYNASAFSAARLIRCIWAI